MKRILLVALVCIATLTSKAGVVNGTCGENLTWSLNTKDSTLIIEGTGNMTSRPWAEYKSYIAHISLPNGLTSFTAYAFDGCNIKGITIPESVTDIETRALAYCSNLVSVQLPEGVTTVAESVFENCKNLESVQLPSTIASIGPWAFSHCTSLTSIIIPDKVDSIGEWAFNECTGLTSIVIPDKVTTISHCLFNGCQKLNGITMGNDVTTIYNKAFCDCSSLTSITIPEKVDSIGEYVLSGCTNLTSVIWNAVDCRDLIYENNPFYCYNGYLGVYHTYDIRQQITSFVFGDAVERIPSGLCDGMNSLTTISIPQNVKRIEEKSFFGCYNLESVSIPEGVSSIGGFAFMNCQKLTTVSIPNSVTSIEYAAFAECKSLTSVTLGKGITDIRGDIFSGSPISCLTVLLATPPAGGTGSGINNTTCRLYVPAESVETYANSIWWEDFMEIHPIEADTPTSTPSNSIVPSEYTRKLLYDGQLLILRDGKTYTVQGQEVK